MLTMNDVRTKIEACMAKAKELYGYGANFSYTIETCRGKAMGWCRLNPNGSYTFRFNSDAMAMGLEAMNNTIPHEVAHAVARQMTGKMGHCKTWRSVCIALGGNGRRCHNESLPPARNTSKHVYIATCGTAVDMSTQRHNKIQRGQVYIVRNTGGRIAANGYHGAFTK